ADIVTVPTIESLTLSENGEWALYVMRQADLGLNRRISSLHRVNLSTGKDQQIFKGEWIENLQAIPGTTAWSVLADLGHGVQLYRVDHDLQVTPILVRTPTVTIGAVEGAIDVWPAKEGPRHLGVLSYLWSPDGRMLWYTRGRLLTQKKVASPIVDEAVELVGATPQWTVPAVIEFRVRLPDGEDILVDQRPTTDRNALFSGGNVSWSRDSATVQFTAENHDADGHRSFAIFAWKVATRQLKLIDAAPVNPYKSEATGPFGGRLQNDGFGHDRQLQELLPDGSKHTYGAVDFRIGDSRASGSWLSPDGARAVVGIRQSGEDPRYGLVVLDRISGVRSIEKAGSSLTHCAFNTAVDAGVCVQEGMVLPPTLVRIDPVAGNVTPVVGLAPRQAMIKPLKVEPRTWINRDGYSATGFVVYPRNYVGGRRYPALVVTHGPEADERFATPGFQWDYPVQVFAERGYIVVCMNPPSPSDYKEINGAYDAWSNASGGVHPARIQDLIWLTGVHSFEAAITELVAQGLVDPDRVGIAGFSFGSQMVNVTMTQSSMFKAASSGDGGYLEPSGYFSMRQTYKAAFGGSPYDPVAQENYRRLSPTFRATLASGPILQQIARTHSTKTELYDALRSAGIPTQITLYSGEGPTSDETHQFHIPSNRLAAMEENLDWFDFWLRGTEDSAPAKAAQYKRWRKMRKGWDVTHKEKEREGFFPRPIR